MTAIDIVQGDTPSRLHPRARERHASRARRFPKRFAFFASVAAIVLSPVVVLGLFLLPRQELRLGPTTTYRGELGGKPAWLRLTMLESGEATGELECSDGRVIQIKRTDGDLWASGLVEGATDDEAGDSAECNADRPISTLRIHIENGCIEGVWIGGCPERREPISFQAVADTQSISRVVGYQTATGRGREVTYHAIVPRFVEPTSFDRRAGSMLRQVVEDAARTHATWPWSDWEDLRWTFREFGFPNLWTYEDDWQLTYRGDRLISLLCVGSCYTGGAHENYYFDERVIWWTGREARRVQLEDLFRTDTDWQDTLLAYCAQDLGQQKQARSVEGSTAMEPQPVLDLNQLETFTVHEAGLRFHFAPYEVGSFVEGPFEVLMPWQALRSVLATTGPAQALPIPHHAKEAS